MFFYKNKAYDVDITGYGNDAYLSIFEMYQDKDNTWHIPVTPLFFCQGDEVKYFIKDCGGAYTDKVIRHLDLCGVLK